MRRKVVSVTKTAVGDAAERETGNNCASPGFNFMGVSMIVGDAEGRIVVGSVAIATNPPPPTAAVGVDFSPAAGPPRAPYGRAFSGSTHGGVGMAWSGRLVFIGPKRLAALVVDAGLVGWLIGKVA